MFDSVPHYTLGIILKAREMDGSTAFMSSNIKASFQEGSIELQHGNQYRWCPSIMMYPGVCVGSVT